MLQNALQPIHVHWCSAPDVVHVWRCRFLLSLVQAQLRMLWYCASHNLTVWADWFYGVPQLHMKLAQVRVLHKISTAVDHLTTDCGSTKGQFSHNAENRTHISKGVFVSCAVGEYCQAQMPLLCRVVATEPDLPSAGDLGRGCRDATTDSLKAAHNVAF